MTIAVGVEVGEEAISDEVANTQNAFDRFLILYVYGLRSPLTDNRESRM